MAALKPNPKAVSPTVAGVIAAVNRGDHKSAAFLLEPLTKAELEVGLYVLANSFVKILQHVSGGDPAKVEAYIQSIALKAAGR